MIAQEEFAKSFLLGLVVRSVIPWDRRLVRAAHDHICKQLLIVVMDYLSPDTDEFVERCDAVVLRKELPQLPSQVVDALNILRHEKIGRWVDHNWFWAEMPVYDPSAKAIAKGKKDRVKQDALYVRLAVDGGVASMPAERTLLDVRMERERAERLAHLTEEVLRGKSRPGLDYDLVEEVFRLLFDSLGDFKASE